jgi:hypothetical protein
MREWAKHKVNDFFVLGEFLPPDAHEIIGDPIKFFEQEGHWINRVSLALRKTFGPMIVNNWMGGGQFVARGYRLNRGVSAQGGTGSRHRLGLALDCHFTNTSVAEAQKHLILNSNFWLKNGVVRFERTANGKPITWLHVDAGRSVLGFDA